VLLGKIERLLAVGTLSDAMALTQKELRHVGAESLIIVHEQQREI
jgi:hypothetical protein